MNQRKAGALLSYVNLFLTVVVGIFYTPILLAKLGTGEYGVYSVATAAIAFLTILDLGFNQTMIRYTAKYKALGDVEGERRCNGMFLILYVCIAVVALIAGIILSFNLEKIFQKGFTPEEAAHLEVIFIILLANLVISFPLSIYGAILQANEGFFFLKMMNIITFVLTYGGILAALFCGFKATAMAVITTAVSISIKLITAFFVSSKYKVKFKFRGFDKVVFKEIMAFSFFIFLNIVIDQLYANTDKFILGALYSTAAVTTYTVGIQFSSYFQEFSTSISGVFLPRITKLVTVKKDLKEVSEIFVKIGRIQFILLGFLMSGFVVFGMKFISLWVGEGQIKAYAIALVVILPGLIPLSQNIGISVLRALNKHRFRSIIYIFIAIFNVALSIPLALKYGGFGAACATGLATVLGQIITMNWFYYKKIGLDIPGYWREISRIILAIIPIGIIGFGLHIIPIWNMKPFDSWIGLILQCIIYMGIFFVMGWILIFNSYEKDLIVSILRKILTICFKMLPIKKIIIFESHPDFSDNSYAVYKYILENGLFSDYKFYWAVHNMSETGNLEKKLILDLNKDSLKQPDMVTNNIGLKDKFTKDSVKELLATTCFYKKGGSAPLSVLKRVWVESVAEYILDSNIYVKKCRSTQVRIYLGHGMPIKVVTDYTNSDATGSCDAYLLTGEYWKDVYMKLSNFDEKMFAPIGYPRNDILVTENDVNESVDKKQFGGTDFEKIIVWMPTYRNHHNKESEIKNIAPFGMPEVYSKEECNKLNEVLKEQKTILLFRPHPAENISLIEEISLSNIRIANDTFLKENNLALYEVLCMSDALITDYSSVYFDYLLTLKPIGLTISDSKQFFDVYKSAFEDYENEIGGYKIKNFNELLDFIILVSKNDLTKEEESKKKELLENMVSMRDKFHDVTDGSSTKKVVEIMLNRKHE